MFLDWFRRPLILARGKAVRSLKAFSEYPSLTRSIERLWLDGGTAQGFDDMVKLGWAEYRFFENREWYGRLTAEGIAVLNSMEG